MVESWGADFQIIFLQFSFESGWNLASGSAWWIGLRYCLENGVAHIWLPFIVRPVVHLSNETQINLTRTYAPREREKYDESEALIVSEKTVVAGEEVKLFCPIIGFPSPMIEWKKHGMSHG